MEPISNEVLDQICLGHIEQLAELHIPEALRAGPDGVSVGLDLPEETLFATKETLIDWIRNNSAAVNAAKACQVKSFRPATPNWDNVLFSLIESAAMYLRRRTFTINAIQKAHEDNKEEAKEFLAKAQEYVDDVADALGCHFVQLAEFADVGPDGTWWHSGAYSGAFISKDTNKPFIGVAFKGSDSMRDWVTDADWTPMQSEQSIAFGSKVHQGFYKGLFGKFTSGGVTKIPFEVLVGNLLAAVKGRQNTLLHFTGHSLGGAYCTLSYGEFLRRPNLVQAFNLGDMYSIAAPRTCFEPFATEVAKRTNGASGSTKYTFRIVNEKDPVTTIPPRTASQLKKYPFVHPDGAWKMWKTKGPEKVPNERAPGKPADPLPFIGIIWNAPDHFTTSYYESWKKTPHTGGATKGRSMGLLDCDGSPSIEPPAGAVPGCDHCPSVCEPPAWVPYGENVGPGVLPSKGGPISIGVDVNANVSLRFGNDGYPIGIQSTSTNIAK